MADEIFNAENPMPNKTTKTMLIIAAAIKISKKIKPDLLFLFKKKI